MLRLIFLIHDADIHQSLFSFRYHQVIFENSNASEVNIGTVWNHFLPVLLGSFIKGAFHQPEIRSIKISADIEMIIVMIYIIYKSHRAGIKNSKASRGIGCIEKTML